MFELGFVLKKLISSLILPPVIVLLTMLVGILLMRKRRALGVALLWLSAIVTLAISTPTISGALLSSLQDFPALDPSRASNAQAIVILAGGLRRNSAEYGSDQPSSTSLERLRYGAWLAKRTKLPILITGGIKYDGPTEAEVMAQVLQDDYGLTARWIDSQARDTAENATYSVRLLASASISRVLLVTHAWHMRRAMQEFARTPLQVIAAPTAFRISAAPDNYQDVLPNAVDLSGSATALHEWVGMAWSGIRRP